ncbi:MAG: transposase IS116/IS110/IS902 family protein [Candidatus Magnetoglobus multicellularis str. Araruama]|uniref:Transposase IS116/IS110/IS902 family protein n=1 Tax=Candidatus Magnetoglobus multicellularis str. Araruama TaxID=890399 RepID=A0A1V1NZR6_9BACT|nr:MAG: transposase IS116/IS110/IS902 family protein [Candidatus Magnetoglobus multicellularis str. Araruama]
MKSYVGIDLHSTNSVIGIIDEDNNQLFLKKLPNKLEQILLVLEEFRETNIGIVVESTYNWYWLVDGLLENNYKVHLANPSGNIQYSGLKHSDDKKDSLWLANLLRLNILKEGYIYPKKDRPVRDLLRRRILFVKQRTAQILSFQSMITRNLGIKKSSNEIKKLKPEEVIKLFNDKNLLLMASCYMENINHLTTQIRIIEKEIKEVAKLKKEFECLLTINGIGNILALTIMFEVGDIGRFPKVGNYSSYCRCVSSVRKSNNKKKGEGNRKNGNKYLSWAYVEAANFSRRYCQEAQSFYQRKKSKTNEIVATKALANKLARASYYIMRDKVPFDPQKLFK